MPCARLEKGGTDGLETDLRVTRGTPLVLVTDPSVCPRSSALTRAVNGRIVLRKPKCGMAYIVANTRSPDRFLFKIMIRSCFKSEAPVEDLTFQDGNGTGVLGNWGTWAPMIVN